MNTPAAAGGCPGGSFLVSMPSAVGDGCGWGAQGAGAVAPRGGSPARPARRGRAIQPAAGGVLASGGRTGSRVAGSRDPVSARGASCGGEVRGDHAPRNRTGTLTRSSVPTVARGLCRGRCSRGRWRRRCAASGCRCLWGRRPRQLRRGPVPPARGYGAAVCPVRW